MWVFHSCLAYFSLHNALKPFGSQAVCFLNLASLKRWTPWKEKGGEVEERKRGGMEDGHPQFLKLGCVPD